MSGTSAYFSGDGESIIIDMDEIVYLSDTSDEVDMVTVANMLLLEDINFFNLRNVQDVSYLELYN